MRPLRRTERASKSGLVCICGAVVTTLIVVIGMGMALSLTEAGGGLRASLFQSRRPRWEPRPPDAGAVDLCLPAAVHEAPERPSHVRCTTDFVSGRKALLLRLRV